MKTITDLFLHASGADTQLLEQYPSDRNKYIGVGGTVIFTSLFAGMAAAYALFTVFDSYWISAALGIIWGLMIFNLDRFIVSSMRKEELFFSELWTALPRFVLAIIISLVIAKPFELKIFAKEIEPELVLMEQEVYLQQDKQVQLRFEPTHTQLQAEIQVLQKEIADKILLRDQSFLNAQQEADGTGGSKRKNLGPIYKIKKAVAEKTQLELDALTQRNIQKIAELEGKLNESQIAMTSATDALVRTQINGPAARIEALSRLTEKNEAMWWAHIFIILLFLMIESAPILLKLLSRRGPYDSLINIAEHESRCKEIAAVAFATDETRKGASNFGQTEQNYVTRKLDAELI